MGKPISLTHETPFAVGDHKAVYIHPNDSSLLIKVVHEAGLEALKAKYPWSMKFRRLPNYWEFLHEMVEHLAVRELMSPAESYIENVIGLVDTDLGVGMIVEAIRSPTGEVAPTLRNLIQGNTFKQKHEDALNEILDWIVNTNVIIRELTTTNMVWNDTTQRFVIIDGIGSKPLLTLRSFSKRYNKRSNFKKSQKLKMWVQEGLSKHASQ